MVQSPQQQQLLRIAHQNEPVRTFCRLFLFTLIDISSDVLFSFHFQSTSALANNNVSQAVQQPQILTIGGPNQSNSAALMQILHSQNYTIEQTQQIQQEQPQYVIVCI